MKIASMAGAGSRLLSARNNLAFDECQTGHGLKIAAANRTCRRSIEIIWNRQIIYENVVEILTYFYGFGRFWANMATGLIVSRNWWCCKECET